MTSLVPVVRLNDVLGRGSPGSQIKPPRAASCREVLPVQHVHTAGEGATMQMRQLGHSGLMVSAVGIGCNAFGARTDADEVRAIVDAAADHGINFFDTADMYTRGASERLLGQALRGRRDEFIVATKFGMDVDGLNGADHGARGSRAYLRRAVLSSLERLGTDYLDLYQYHTPDGVTPIEETLSALDDLVHEGLVRYVGCSNMMSWQVADAHWQATTRGLTPFITAQNAYSLYNRSAEAELVPACEQFGLSVLPYFPLAYGLLTGKYRRGEQAPAGSRLEKQAERLAGADFDRVEALRQFADERGISLLTLAMSGLAAQPAVGSVISGVSRVEQVASNVEAMSWTPSTDDLAALDQSVPRGTGEGYSLFTV